MKNNKKGFTLVELVIVVAVMAVLVAVAIPTVSSILATAEDAVAESNAQTIESMIKLEKAELHVEGGSAAELSADTIKAALEDAALGIEEGTFYYNDSTGVCTLESTAETGETEYTITYEDGAVTVE